MTARVRRNVKDMLFTMETSIFVGFVFMTVMLSSNYAAIGTLLNAAECPIPVNILKLNIYVSSTGITCIII